MGRRKNTREFKKMEKQMEKEDLFLLEKLEGKPVRHTGRKIFLTLITLFSLSLIFMYFLFDVAGWQKLDIQKILGAPQTGVLYDRDGHFLSPIQSSQTRYSVPLSAVPLHVQQAFLAAEDLRFYDHMGFDPIRMMGAVIANIKSSSYSQGASTITQQLVKLSHLSSQKTIARKLEEIYLALQLEAQYDKNEILEMYLNFVYFGRGAYGIEAAAQSFFGVQAKDLTPAQGACLAASIKAPSVYAPHKSMENNKSRRNYILRTMLREGFIGWDTFAAAEKEEIILKEMKAPNTAFGWYTDAALDEAEKILHLSSDELLCGGYHIFTCMDKEQQQLIDTLYKSAKAFPVNASDGTRVQSAMSSVDVRTGAVLAVMGGRSYDVQRGLNRATQLRRQPGSALKPLAVYAPAIEYHGYTTASVLDDTPRAFGSYTPRNSGYKYYGNVTMRTAIARSLNVPAVSLLNDIGIPSGVRYLKNAGIPLDDRDGNLSLALGSMTYGVSPVQLAASYAPFANGGLYYSPYFVEKIQDAAGNVLYQHEIKETRVLSEQSAYLMTSLLQSVTSSGTGAKLSRSGTPVAGKTGTVNMEKSGNRDIWMAAYNSEISTAFWMGFDHTDSAHKLAGWVSGGDHTAALAANFFKQYYQGKPKPAFRKADQLIWLSIDKKAVEVKGEAMLATSLTPKAYKYSEVFTVSNRPWKESNVWTAPASPSAFHITHNDQGKPVLVITAADTALYRIQRDAQGESIVLNELNGKKGETLYYTDQKAVSGITYTYRVIPVNQELLTNGILLEGKQAVQIAKALPSGSVSRLWEDITDALFGSAEEEDEAEESLSLFWKSSD